MPTKHAIRWKDKDVRELNRIVKNYNAKIRRVRDRSPAGSDFLPEVESVREIRKSITTRRELNKKLRSLERFSRKGAEKLVTNKFGVTETAYKIKEVAIKNRIENQKKAYKRKALDLTTEKGLAGQVETQNLRPKKFTFDKPQKEWEKFVKAVEKKAEEDFTDKLAERYKENYIQGIRNQLGNKGQPIIELVKLLDAKDVYNYSVGNPRLSIDFMYDPLDVDTRVEFILEEWIDVTL